MVAACVLSAALEEPLMPWWSEWPRSIPVPASVDPLDGFLSPNDSTDVTVPPADAHSAHDVPSVETPLESIDPATPPAAPQASPQTPTTSRRSTDERPAAPGSSGDEDGEPRAPPRPANFLPPFFDSELRVVRRPRRAIDLTGPHPRQPPPSSGATPPPDRRKRRYASGELLLHYFQLTTRGRTKDSAIPSHHRRRTTHHPRTNAPTPPRVWFGAVLSWPDVPRTFRPSSEWVNRQPVSPLSDRRDAALSYPGGACRTFRFSAVVSAIPAREAAGAVSRAPRVSDSTHRSKSSNLTCTPLPSRIASTASTPRRAAGRAREPMEWMEPLRLAELSAEAVLLRSVHEHLLPCPRQSAALLGFPAPVDQRHGHS